MFQSEHNCVFTGTLWKFRKTRKTTLELWLIGGKWVRGMELDKVPKFGTENLGRRKSGENRGSRLAVVGSECQ